MPVSHREEVEAILGRARDEHVTLLEQLSPPLRASLPVDAAGITRAIDHLAAVVGLSARLRDEQTRGHRANPAVLHGRVFGRTPLSRATVLAAFVEGARVREGALRQLARRVGGSKLEDAVRELLAARAPELAGDDDTADAVLRAVYAAQEEAAMVIATHLDARER